MPAQFTNEEAALMADQHFFLAKAQIMAKMRRLLAATHAALKGEVGDRGKFREAIRSVAPRIRAPRGSIQFDRYQQVITNIYIMKVERQGGRLVNVTLDTIPNTSQEESWKWWNK